MMRTVMMSCGLMLALALSGCDQQQGPEPPPQPTPREEAVALGNVQIRVIAVEHGTPELVEVQDEYSVSIGIARERVMIVRMGFKNVGEEPVRYRPQHVVSPTVTGTPMLFQWPADEEGQRKPPAVPSINLGGLYTLGQLHAQEVPIAKGEEIIDEYLFEIPPSNVENLMLTIPASLFGGSGDDLARILIPNKADAVKEPPVVGIGKALEKDGVSITVTSADAEWIEVEPMDESKVITGCPYGFTNTSVLKVAYTIDNKSSNTISYIPSHRESNSDEVKLTANGKPVSRYSLGVEGAVRFKGQLADRETTIPPGESFKDYFVFQDPESAKKLRLEIAGDIVDTEGIYLYEFDYTPPKDELKRPSLDCTPPPENPEEGE